MNFLSSANAKDRKNTAGKLAVFFLICLFGFSSCSAIDPDNQEKEIPFVQDGKLYSFTVGSPSSFNVRAYDLYNFTEGFSQRAVSSSSLNGYILAWSKKTQNLYHIDINKKITGLVSVSGQVAYVNQNYILTQTNTFIESKGFSFTLYKINYSRNGKKIKTEEIWNGEIDCFISDVFFTDDGICISGGNQNDSKNNVYYITGNGIHKCYAIEKNSNFLRIMNDGNDVYAFLSGRDKSAAEPLLYKFALNNSDGKIINLKNDLKFPSGFDCFFGYGFSMTNPQNESSRLIVLPASVKGVISFMCIESKTGHISSVVSDVTGCVAGLGAGPEGYYYMARDPLIEGSYYGIALFDGKTSGRIHP